MYLIEMNGFIKKLKKLQNKMIMNMIHIWHNKKTKLIKVFHHYKKLKVISKENSEISDS